MITNHDQMEQLLKKVVPPEYASEAHRRQLRGQLLSQIETRAAGAGGARRLGWKIALVLGLLAAGAAATELVLQVRRFHFEGRGSDGTYRFATEPQTVYQSPRGVSVVQSMVSISDSDRGELDAAGLEQKRKDLEEIDALRQRDIRELVGVTDTTVNGRPFHRTFTFKYVLADGRTETVNEGGLESAQPPSPAQMEQDLNEIAGLRQRGEREVTKIIDTELDGQIQRTLICRYVLSDGREQTMGEGDQDLPTPAKTLTPEQRQELSRLELLNLGQALDSAQAQVFGRTYAFRRRSFQLSDGTVVIQSAGTPAGLKSDLTEADWKELRELSAAHEGQTLGTYEEEVRGKLLTFTCVRYVLSEGTEVIRSHGE